MSLSEFNLTPPMGSRLRTIYEKSLGDGMALMEFMPEEFRGPLKQAAHDNGIPYGEEMARFISWAEMEICS